MTLDQEKFPQAELEEKMTKKPYTSPELIVHGAVEKLTEGTNRGNQNDGGCSYRSA
jgi:hypothetical protein